MADDISKPAYCGAPIVALILKERLYVYIVLKSLSYSSHDVTFRHARHPLLAKIHLHYIFDLLVQHGGGI
jgi:hypothetical protein